MNASETKAPAFVSFHCVHYITFLPHIDRKAKDYDGKSYLPLL
jgi:hypothetical protein